MAGRDWEFVENFEDGLRIDVLTPRKGWNVIGYCRYEYYLGFQKVWSISDLNEARDDAITEQQFFLKIFQSALKWSGFDWNMFIDDQQVFMQNFNALAYLELAQMAILRWLSKLCQRVGRALEF